MHDRQRRGNVCVGSAEVTIAWQAAPRKRLCSRQRRGNDCKAGSDEWALFDCVKDTHGAAGFTQVYMHRHVERHVYRHVYWHARCRQPHGVASIASSQHTSSQDLLHPHASTRLLTRLARPPACLNTSPRKTRPPAHLPQHTSSQDSPTHMCLQVPFDMMTNKQAYLKTGWAFQTEWLSTIALYIAQCIAQLSLDSTHCSRVIAHGARDTVDTIICAKRDASQSLRGLLRRLWIVAESH